MLTNISVTTGVDCRGFKHVSLECPTYAIGMAAATAIAYCNVCAASGGTFRPLYDTGKETSDIVQAWNVPAGAGNFIVPIDCFEGYSYVKFHFNNSASASCYYPIVHLSE
jgi:hypothetical protein